MCAKGQITKHCPWYQAAILLLLVELCSDNTPQCETSRMQPVPASGDHHIPCENKRPQFLHHCSLIRSTAAPDRASEPFHSPSRPRRQNAEYGSAFRFVLCLEPYENTV